VSFLSTVSRTHDARDLALAEELGRRVAGMVQADRVATRERHLRTVTTALGAAATVAEVTLALLDSLGAILGTQRATVHIVRPDDPSHLQLAHGVGSPPVVAELAVLPVSAPEPPAVAVAMRGALWLNSPRARTSGDPEVADGGRAVAALPLLIEDRVVGVVTLTFPTDRAFPEDERAFIVTVVNQAAQALDRAVNADARRQIADTLQRGLLPAKLPAVARLSLAARYLPAGVHTAAGGDWYDVTVLDDDHVGISVGDVVGHGAQAAAVMGQLRSALAGYLLESHSPAHAVQWLSRFARGIAGARASTAICLVLNTTSGELRWARAGHPPPLVLHPADDARYLDDARGTVLGLMQDSPITEGHAQLTPGSTVVLYTDGLVERRGEILDDGLDRLAAACREDRAPDRLIPVLLREALGGDQPGDDVAVIAARLLPGPLHERLPAQPASLAVLRRTVARWASAAALPEEQSYDLQLGLGEAAANAVEHAYRGAGPGEVSCRLDRAESGDVHVEVCDEGSWRPPADPGYRGRGLRVIAGVGTDVALDHDGPGTRVRFTVPAPPPDLEPRPGPTPPPRPDGRPAVLEQVPAAAGLTLRLSGDVDLASVGSVRASLLDRLDGTGPVLLDIRRITHLSSAGVGLLLESIEAAPGRLRLLVDPDGPAGRSLALAGLDRLVP
jgi:anti-anti-sigma factor